MIKRCVLIYGRRLGRRKCLSAMQPSKRAVPRNPHMLVFSFWKNHPRKLRGQCSGQDLRPRTLRRRRQTGFAVGRGLGQPQDSPRTAPQRAARVRSSPSAPPSSRMPSQHRPCHHRLPEKPLFILCRSARSCSFKGFCYISPT